MFAQENARYTPPPRREEITTTCPSLEASPAQVRDWVATYLIYRGLDTADADAFFMRGYELHKIPYSVLVEAFKMNCGLADWEADLVAYDVFMILEGSIPPLQRGIFQKYVEAVFGVEYYAGLMRWARPNPGFLDWANVVFSWIGFSIAHSILLIVFSVFLDIMTQ